MIDEKLLNTNVVLDQPKETDFTWEEYAEGVNDGKGKIVDKVSIKVWNQFSQKETYKACSCYGLTGIYNAYQSIEFKEKGIEFDQENPKYNRKTFQAERGYPNIGASLQDMMSFFKRSKLIDGYVKCKTLQEVKNAINNGCLIYTGSNKCDWGETGKTGYFSVGEGIGHIFFIKDYGENGLFAQNSFGEKWGANGDFVVPNEDFDKLFSCYAIIDHDDSGKIASMLYKLQYQKAIELGITNGTRPSEPVTREECAVMCYRAMKKMAI